MLQIGEFAQIGRVSIKMLRHYDDIGLLKPAHVDHTSGYRHYTLDQVERVHRIVALRELGFSLGQVRLLLDDTIPSSHLHDSLQSLRVEVMNRIADDRARLAAIDASLGMATSESPSHRPVIRRSRPQLVASLRVRDRDSTELFEHLEAEVARHQARAARPPLLLRHDSGEADVVIPLTVPIPEEGDIVVRELPGADAAMSVIHRGDYDSLPETYEMLTREMTGWGLGQAGPLHILYHRFGADCTGYELAQASLAAHVSEFVTELLIPVTPAQDSRFSS